MIAGLLLAAGAGTRMGRPKALVTDGPNDEPWVVTAAQVLRDGGCHRIVVAVGAESAAVERELLRTDAQVVRVPRWRMGLSESLRCGLQSLDRRFDAVAVHLVDLPDVGADVVARVLKHAGRDVLARAFFGDLPGHPVLIGRRHWTPLAQSISGDAGAHAYLGVHSTVHVQCGDLAVGEDQDHSPEALSE